MKVRLSILKEYLSCLLVEGRVEDVREQFPDMDDEDFDYLVANQPAGSNNKYLQWSCKQFDDGFSTEVTIQAVRLFDGNKQRLTKRDLTQYKDVGEVEAAIAELGGKSKGQKSAQARADTDTIYQDDQFVVLRPHTQEASCKYGTGTSWCIAATKSHNYFGTYSSSNNKFYFVIDKKAVGATPESKFALAIMAPGQSATRSNVQIYNASDKLVDISVVAKHVGAKWPEIWQKIQAHVTANPSTREVDDAQKATEEHVKALLTGQPVTQTAIEKIAKDGKLTSPVVKALVSHYANYSGPTDYNDIRSNVMSSLADRVNQMPSDAAMLVIKWILSTKPAPNPTVQHYWRNEWYFEQMIRSANLAPDDFREVAKSSDETLLAQIFVNPNAPDDLKTEIASMVKSFTKQSARSRVYVELIRSGKITVEQFTDAMADDKYILQRFLQNPSTINLSDELIRLIPVNAAEDIKNILQLPNISAEYTALLIDKNWQKLNKYELYDILKTTKLDVNMIETLWKDKGQDIRMALLQNPSIGPGNTSTFAKSKNSAYRFAIAHNPVTSVDDLLVLATDESVSTRAAVGANPKMPGNELTKLARDEAIAVRASVATNKSTPLETLKALTRDTDSHTSKSARKTIKSLQTAEAFRHIMMGTLLREALEDDDNQDLMTPGWQDLRPNMIGGPNEFIAIFLLQNNGHATREEIETAYAQKFRTEPNELWKKIRRGENYGNRPSRATSSTGKGWFWSPAGINKGALMRLTPSGAAAAMEILNRLRSTQFWPSSHVMPDVRKSPAPAALNPNRVNEPAASPIARGPKTTYKIYGKFKGHPASTRLKGQAYVGATGTRFAPGEQAYITPEDGKLKVKKTDSDHTQTWEPIDG